MRPLFLFLLCIAVAHCRHRTFVVKRASEDDGGFVEGAARCKYPTHLPGPQCLALMIRYTYNPKTKDCEAFDYGGCNPSPNNFETMKECRATCVKH